MKKALLNYWVDMVTGAAFLVCAFTGILRLFPDLASVSATGTVTILGIPATLWATVHDWSAVVMTAGVGLHTALHLRWLVTMTRRVSGGESATVSGRAARVAAASPARGAARAGSSAAVSPDPAPQVVAAASLRRLEEMGADKAGVGERTTTRKGFLLSAAAVGGAVALGGLVLARRETGSGATGIAASDDEGLWSEASGQDGSSYGDESSAGAQGSAGTQSSGTSSGATTTATRVAVDPGACVGCARCAQVCPVGVFTMSGGKAVAQSPDACRLCGRCVQVCPANAITLSA
jgi:NAD-dependent dihydropyrimidine dehydrogenase PreA subunit